MHAPGSRLLAIDDGTPWSPAATAPYEFMLRAFAAMDVEIVVREKGTSAEVEGAAPSEKATW